METQSIVCQYRLEIQFPNQLLIYEVCFNPYMATQFAHVSVYTINEASRLSYTYISIDVVTMQSMLKCNGYVDTTVTDAQTRTY
jgi:hypothetical protein